MSEEKRKRIGARWSSLKNERSSWDAHWKEIAEYLLPRSGRFFIDDRNKGDRRHNSILDSTGTRAQRILSAGLMAGMTSPARPWFRLTTSDPQLDESSAVKAWLADVTRLMAMVFTKSNTYRALHTQYDELGGFGTSANIVLPNFDTVIHSHPLTIGEFAISTNALGYVDTLYREVPMTVDQVVEEFGLESVSSTVRGLYTSGKLDQWVPIVHAIQKRKKREVGMRDARNMEFESIYYEKAGDTDKLLRESGFKDFPALCPRWAVGGGDIYGYSPGMEALGDIKQLMHEQKRKAQGIDYMTMPPLQVPTSARANQINTLPGGISYVDAANPNGGIRNAFEVRIDLNHLLADIQDVRERIKSSFYADMFLMINNTATTQMTATEVAERHEEKLLMLGPVLERLHNEMLDPLIEMTFQRMVEANILPPAPEEMQGMNLNVEFVSMLAQAQRAIATNSIDRYVGNLGVIAGMKPDVLDKFDSDRWADAYADALGIDPELIVPGERVAVIRQQRAEAQQAQIQAEQAAQRADVAAKLGSVDTSKQTALTDVTRAFSGYT